jgi:hypothetical protein
MSAFIGPQTRKKQNQLIQLLKQQKQRQPHMFTAAEMAQAIAFADGNITKTVDVKLPGKRVRNPKKQRFGQQPNRVPWGYRNSPEMSCAEAPVSIGTTVSLARPKQSNRGRKTVLAGKEFLGVINENNNSTDWQLSAMMPIHPAYYPAGGMGNMCRSFSKYRFTKMTAMFVTRQPTSVTGEIIICFADKADSPAENGASAAFLARVSSKQHVIMGPLWQNHSLAIACDLKWRPVDAFASIDLFRDLMGEIQVYTLSAVTDIAGYLILDYEIEFDEVQYIQHSGTLPWAQGPGTAYTLVDSSTTPTHNVSVQTTNVALSGLSNGSVIKCVLDVDTSTLATGTNASNAWLVAESINATTTTQTTFTNAITLIDGLTFYAVVIGASLYLYNSLESAVAGDASGQFYYGVTGSTAGSYNVIAYPVRYGVAVIEIVT